MFRSFFVFFGYLIAADVIDVLCFTCQDPDYAPKVESMAPSAERQRDFIEAVSVCLYYL